MPDLGCMRLAQGLAKLISTALCLLSLLCQHSPRAQTLAPLSEFLSWVLGARTVTPTAFRAGVIW